MKKYYTQITFFIIVIVLLTISFLTYRNLNNYIEEVALIRHSNQVLRILEMTLSSIKDAETAHRGYELTADSTFLEPYKEAIVEIPILVKELDSLVAGNVSQVEGMDSIKIVINSQLLLIPQILSNTSRSSLYMDTYERALLFRSKKNTDEIRTHMKKIIDAETETLNTRVVKEKGFQNIAPIAILMYALVAIGGGVILFYRLIDALRVREKAEHELAESNEVLKQEVSIREFTQTLLRSVLDNSPNGIMAFKSIRNKQNEIIDFEAILANQTSLRSSDKKENDIVGRRMLEVFPDVKDHELFEFYKKAATSDLIMRKESYNRYGVNKWFSVSAVKLEDGLVVTYADITEQKDQIAFIKERELLLRQAEVLATMGSWSWTAKDNHMIWSDGLVRILGNVTEEKRSWENFIEIAHEEDKEAIRKFIADSRNKLDGSRLEYRGVIKGSIRHFYILVTSEMEIDEEKVLGIVVDITELKLKEKQLEHSNMDLKRSNEDLEQFAYVASHDLQEPLRKIRAFGDLVAQKYTSKIEGTGTDYIERMQNAAARMQVLIQDLLSFSRVSRNSSDNEPIETNAMMKEVMDDLGDQIRREAASVQLGNLPSIWGDKTQLKRLFQNLVSNAIKFHKPNEKPDIKISGSVLTAADQLRYFSAAQPHTRYVKFIVEDSGIGFEQQYAEKIFNIFQRLNGRMDYEGTGIGLAICRKIATNHRGVVTAESKEGEGSRFIIILPSD